MSIYRPVSVSPGAGAQGFEVFWTRMKGLHQVKGRKNSEPKTAVLQKPALNAR
jgi:hypothetical protein